MFIFLLFLLLSFFYCINLVIDYQKENYVSKRFFFWATNNKALADDVNVVRDK